MHSHTLLFLILEENVLPSSSSNYSLAIETYQTNFKPSHEIENNFNKPPD